LARGFFDLTLRILNDFLLWLESGLQGTAPTSDSKTQRTAIPDEAKRSKWSTLAVDDLILIQADIVTLREKIINILEPLIVVMLLDAEMLPNPESLSQSMERVRNELSSYNEDHSHPIDPMTLRCAHLVTSGLHNAQERFSAAFDSVREQIVAMIAQDCCVHLQTVAGIKKNFQMTGRKPPSTASAYVANILQPLKSALDDNASKIPENSPARLSVAYRKQLCLEVGEAVTARFLIAVKELLSMVQRTEASLNSLKRLQGQKAYQSLGDTMSDSDKIRLQVFLDVKEFRQRVALFGVEVNTLELEDLVRLPAVS